MTRSLCIAIGLLLAQASGSFGQGVKGIVEDVTQIADGSFAAARTTASQQAINGKLKYRSTKANERKTFSGDYLPPTLPADKKDKFIYGLALFSDDGCDVTVDGTKVHGRLGLNQHLPDLDGVFATRPGSFYQLPVVLSPGKKTSITVNYSNTIYVSTPGSPGFPDIDGCTLFLVLLPVEILDKDKKAVTKLKVGKMAETGVLSGTGSSATLDIDKDSDRFYVRIPGAASMGAVSIKVATVENPDASYNDDETEIDMQVEGNDLITKSMLLVSDDVDDDHQVNSIADDAKNDRTHKIQLGGKFQVKSIKIGGVEHQADAKTPVPVEKTTSFGVFILRQTAGGAPVIAQANVEQDLKVCQERYATVGVKLSWTMATVDPPSGVDLSDGLTEFTTNSPTTEEKALFDGLGTPSAADVHVFYVNSLSNGSLGEAFPPSYFSNQTDQRYVNNIVIPANRSFFAPPHELGHIYLNDASHSSDPTNLMTDQQAAATNIILGDKRITPTQGATIRSSTLIK